MIETGDAIATFIDKISKAAEASALRDRDMLLDPHPAGPSRRRGARRRPTTTLLPRGRHARAARRRRPGGAPLLRLRAGPAGAARRDRSAVRPDLRARSTCPTWHADVASYDVSLGGARIGRIHLDLHPRAEQVQPRRAVHAHRRRHRPPAARGRAGLQLPARADGARRRRHAVPRVRAPGPPRPGRPPALGAVRRRGHRVGLRRGPVAAARGVGLGRRPCSRASPPTRTATPIPADLVARMREADDFGKGLPGPHPDVLRRAVLPVPPGRARPTAPRSPRCRAPCRRSTRWSRRCPTPTSMPAFGHLDGYSSGYYTYMWSLVIAKDLFSAFDRDNLFDAEVARALPRPDPGPGRPQGRRRPGRGLPRPAVRLRVVRGPGSRSEPDAPARLR